MHNTIEYIFHDLTGILIVNDLDYNKNSDLKRILF